MEKHKQRSRRLPRWWGDAKKMEALVRARPQYSSDAKTMKACGIVHKRDVSALYDVIAWGRGEWIPPHADPLETGLAETFTLLWEEARKRGPAKTRRPKPERRRIPAPELETLQTRLNKVGSEWDLQDIGRQRAAKEEPLDA